MCWLRWCWRDPRTHRHQRGCWAGGQRGSRCTASSRACKRLAPRDMKIFRGVVSRVQLDSAQDAATPRPGSCAPTCSRRAVVLGDKLHVRGAGNPDCPRKGAGKGPGSSGQAARGALPSPQLAAGPASILRTLWGEAKLRHGGTAPAPGFSPGPGEAIVKPAAYFCK